MPLRAHTPQAAALPRPGARPILCGAPGGRTVHPQWKRLVSTTQNRIVTGFLFALGAGAFWGTTGPLSTALYAEGAELTAVGFWRILLAVGGFLIYGIARPGIFRADRQALLIVGLAGGFFVALFEVAFQFAIAGVGIAPAVALLYTAPVMVAVLARVILKESLTVGRLFLAVVVMIGVALTVNGATGETPGEAAGTSTRLMGIAGGLLAAASFAGTTLMARWAVPRYGSVRVLFLELVGGTLILAALLPISGNTPAVPTGAAAWIYILGLGIGSVLAANFCYFAAVKRIDAAPTAVAASIEPVVGALLGLVLFRQGLAWFGWLGLLLVIAGVAGEYGLESLRRQVVRPPGTA